MRVLGGPEPPESVAYSWRMPAPRHERLRDFRIGYVLEDPAAGVSSEIKPALESAVRALEKAGAKMLPGWPRGVSYAELFSTYSAMLWSFLFSVAPPEEQERQRRLFAGRKDSPDAMGASLDFAGWQRHNLRRLAFRAAWQEYFKDLDSFLLPALPVAAFPHDHSPPHQRMPATLEGPIPYLQGLLSYASVTTLTGRPATVAPAEKTQSGLPAGIQIMGPYLEDATPIRLAALLAGENGGFTPPAGY